MHAVPACTEWQHPYVNVFKLCDVDQLKEVVVHGDVKEHMVRCMGGRARLAHAGRQAWPCSMGVPDACMPTWHACDSKGQRRIAHSAGAIRACTGAGF